MMQFTIDAIDVTLESERRVRIHRDRSMELIDSITPQVEDARDVLTQREHMEAVFAYNSMFGIDGSRRAALA